MRIRSADPGRTEALRAAPPQAATDTARGRTTGSATARSGPYALLPIPGSGPAKTALAKTALAKGARP